MITQEEIYSVLTLDGDLSTKEIEAWRDWLISYKPAYVENITFIDWLGDVIELIDRLAKEVPHAESGLEEEEEPG